MAQPLWSNAKLLAFCTTLANYLNSGHTLRLFTNTFLPDPSSPLSFFTEATFTGYAAVPLAGVFATPTLVQNGQYQTTSSVLTFQCTGGSGQVIQGWYIDDGTNMIACQLLDSPVTISAGGQYALQLRPQEISQSIL